MSRFFWICLGGAAGTGARYLLSGWTLARKEGFAGATLFQGIAGFGARSVLHTAHILRLSEDLPIVIEVVDTEEHVERLLAILDEMVPEGLVTLEKARVVKYAPGKRPLGSPK